jgi:hypothetical protein
MRAGVTDGLEVFQDVMVFGVATHGPAVLVDVYGGESNLCGSVRLVITDPEHRRSTLRQLERWCRRGTPLSLIAQGAAVALQNDLALFDA